MARVHRRLWSRSGTDKSSLFLYKNDWNRATFYRTRAIFPLSCKRAFCFKMNAVGVIYINAKEYEGGCHL